LPDLDPPADVGVRRWHRATLLLVVAAAIAIGACTSGGGDEPEAAAAPLVERLGGKTTNFDDGERAFQAELRNMSIAQALRFGESDEVFEQAFTVEEGLGPEVEETGCTSCHVNNGRQPPTGEITFTEIERHDTVLRRPTEIVGELTAQVRAAPAVIGMGLLEAIDPADIEALADPDDEDGDGISGRVHYVTDPETGEVVIGRFGWQAAQATVLSQTSTAFENDLEILTPLLSGPEAEIDEETADLASFYAEGLAVPARRDADDPDAIAGAATFESIGCASCHTPSFTTTEVELPPLSHQDIWPYTDLLLHDMGPDLASDHAQGDASPTEWRTPPLWGLGLHETINGDTTRLHDGRARNVHEAIVWHGGEATASRDAYLDLSDEERAELLTFLSNL
jgi:CxxC motif-containing protein (DUF1111 family)